MKLEQIVQRSSGCPITESVQGQPGGGPLWAAWIPAVPWPSPWPAGEYWL